jgi:pimeloyl-ACP methyl ester carboxylesterase
MLVLVVVGLLSGCLPRREPVSPIATRVLAGGEGSPGRCLVVLLPGRRDSFGVYGRQHFAEMALEAGVVADFVEADAHLGYYEAQTISRRLEADIVGRARDHGVGKIWIAGISMGGLGGTLYAREHPDGVRGVIALSPFLGEQEPQAVAAAGGLAAYRMGPPRAIADYERELWGWLKRYTEDGARRPPLYLGIASDDDLAPGQRLLGDALPRGRVFVEKGGHDWKTWTKLWKDVLAARILQDDCGS